MSGVRGLVPPLDAVGGGTEELVGFTDPETEVFISSAIEDRF